MAWRASPEVYPVRVSTVSPIPKGAAISSSDDCVKAQGSEPLLMEA